MNFFWGFLLVLLLFNEPSMAQDAVAEGSVAEDSLVLDTAVTDSSVLDRPKFPLLVPYGIEIGEGTSFVLGLEWWSLHFSPAIYMKHKPDDKEGMWPPIYALVWSIRTQYVYDYTDHESGFLLYPNIQYLKFFLGVAVGPKVGWFSSSGFDYGASFRLDIFMFFDIEVGYLVNKENMFVTFTFDLSLPRYSLFDP
jgi:hypothetical protein